jgi:uncharacterized protein (DUF2235 family)
MNKRIIVLSDGTGNSAGKVWRTNVWRTFDSLDLAGSDQVAFYDDGVGTSSFKPMAFLGGAFGVGLKRNVLDIYKFVCRNYRSKEDYRKLEESAAKAEGRAAVEQDFKDDEIFAFGFSRGSFTIRMLTGLIAKQGLVKYETEKELNQKAITAYRVHRAENFKSQYGIERPFRAIRNLFVPTKHDKRERPVENITFLGLWDTVAAYGLPVDEMTRGVSRYLWPLELPDRQLNAKVDRACHALSLDDERTTFHPLLWDESAEKPRTALADGISFTSGERLSQVWFAGVHSNVGGGYPDDSLAQVSLTWMLKEATDRGLKLKSVPAADPDAFVHVKSSQDKDGRLYDSRSGLGGYYRYGPRSVTDLCNARLSTDARDCVSIATPKVHESVFSRIAVAAHLYAPVGLPKKYDIVTNTGQVVQQDALPYESAAAGQIRFEGQENVVWSTVWRRRVIYFLTVIASIHQLLYPWAIEFPKSMELTNRLRPLSDVIRLLSNFLPGGATRWINAYASDPLWFLLSAGAIAVLIWISSSLSSQTTDEMHSRWNVSLRRPDAVALNGSSFSVLPYLVVGYLLFVAIYPTLKWIGVPIPAVPITALQIFIDRATAGLFQFIAVAVLVTLLLPNKWIAYVRKKETYKKVILSLRLKIAPAVFAFSLVALAVTFGSHYIFNIRDSFGEFCETSMLNNKPLSLSNGSLNVCKAENLSECPTDSTEGVGTPACGDNCTTRHTTIDTANLCTPTRVYLQSNETYQIILKASGPWTMAGKISNTGGMPITSFLPEKGDSFGTYLVSMARTVMMFALYPLKRSFDRPFGRVILRYGETGNEEDFVDPDEDPRSDGRLDEQFTPKRDGELFVYLNRPVFGLWPGVFRDFNSGKAIVSITRIPN